MMSLLFPVLLFELFFVMFHFHIYMFRLHYCISKTITYNKWFQVVCFFSQWYRFKEYYIVLYGSINISTALNDNLEENSNSKSQQGTEIHTFMLQNLHMLLQSFLAFLIILQIIEFSNFYSYLYASHCMYHSWICSNYQCVRNRGLHLSNYMYQLKCSL